DGWVVLSWLLDLLHDAFGQHGGDLGDIAGYVEDSGEGRWTIFEAINENVPVPVISAALYARFASRQDESFAAKVNAALRQQFGAHAVKSERCPRPGFSRIRCSRGSAPGGRPSRACSSSSERPATSRTAR